MYVRQDTNNSAGTNNKIYQSNSTENNIIQEDLDSQSRKELNHLVKSITQEVIESTVSHSIQDASKAINTVTPELTSSLNKIKSEGVMISKLVKNLKGVTKEAEKINVKEINTNLNMIHRDFDKLEKELHESNMQLEITNSYINKNIPSILEKIVKEVESDIQEQLIATTNSFAQEQREIKEEIKKWAIIILGALAFAILFLIIF